jgi:hypothetical protein
VKPVNRAFYFFRAVAGFFNKFVFIQLSPEAEN